MSGQMQRYKESLSETPGPILMKDMPSISIDYRGLLAYSKDKGIEPAALSKREKDSFCNTKYYPRSFFGDEITEVFILSYPLF